MKKVMKKAVKIARGYEGDWVARMKMALKMAWAIVKRENNKELAVVKENNKFDIFVSTGKIKDSVKGLEGKEVMAIVADYASSFSINQVDFYAIVDGVKNFSHSSELNFN